MFILFLVVWFVATFVVCGLAVRGFWAAHEDNKNSKKGGE